MGINLLLVITLLLLMLLSALVSGSELACFSLTPEDKDTLRRSGQRRDNLLLRLTAGPDRLLSAILIANNIANIAIVILSSTLMYRCYDFASHPLLLFFVETILITFLLLLFCENLPKIYARHNTLSFARRMAYFLNFTEKWTAPLSWLLILPMRHLMKHRKPHGGASVSMNDLSTAYDLTADAIEEDKEILEGIIKFGNISAGSTMTPRVDVIAIEDTAGMQDVLRLVNSAGYSRIPVYHETLDNIRGILYIKDLIAHLGEKNFAWQSIVRKAYFVPQTKHINILLEDFQKNKTHIAVVVDEFGGTAGIVTMEDILEEIVGDIADEYDDETSRLYARLSRHSYLFDGKILLGDFFKLEGIRREPFEHLIGEAETLAGLILEIKGEIPPQETEIDIPPYHLKVVSADKRRIKTIKLTIDHDED